MPSFFQNSFTMVLWSLLSTRVSIVTLHSVRMCDTLCSPSLHSQSGEFLFLIRCRYLLILIYPVRSWLIITLSLQSIGSNLIKYLSESLCCAFSSFPRVIHFFSQSRIVISLDSLSRYTNDIKLSLSILPLSTEFFDTLSAS
jgi:hypothetical protein